MATRNAFSGWCILMAILIGAAIIGWSLWRR